MAKTLNFIVPLIIYPFDIMFSFGETDEELTKALVEKYGIDISKENDDWKYSHPIMEGRTCVLSGGATIVRLRKVPDNPTWMGLMVHEIFHATEFLFRRIGVKLCDKSDEAYAYLIGYVTEKVFEKLKEKR